MNLRRPQQKYTLVSRKYIWRHAPEIAISLESLLFRLFPDAKSWPSRPPTTVTLVCPACRSLPAAQASSRKARLRGQQDGAQLNGREGVLRSLVHCCSPFLALSKKQDVERNLGLQTWDMRAIPICMFLSTQSSPAVLSRPVLGTPSVKHYASITTEYIPKVSRCWYSPHLRRWERQWK